MFLWQLPAAAACGCSSAFIPPDPAVPCLHSLLPASPDMLSLGMLFSPLSRLGGWLHDDSHAAFSTMLFSKPQPSPSCPETSVLILVKTRYQEEDPRIRSGAPTLSRQGAGSSPLTD